ncbi:MAG: c-type cytochrome [Pseudomonadota bacterium]|nr:c-type cytochrome [Pseudomonadota bacterium]MDO7667776.1 c-type cytochrome [Pseudomonadota bacterium]MDO7711207.1 c-type cytochrome [Pseudomonadota bacterium]
MVTQKPGKFIVGSIVTFLIIFGVIKIVLLSSQDAGKQAVTPESMTAEDVAERIKPIAQTYIGEAPVVAAVVEEEEIVGGGQQIVTQVCSMCHSSGMMNSPKLGSKADWAPRIEKGIETLYSNAINGINMMPARGGRPDLSDDDIKAAVDYMVSLAK